MSVLVIAVSSFVIALSGALVPGPLFTITVGESVKRGFAAGPLIIFGHAILEAAIVLLIVFGVMPAVSSEKTKIVAGFAGGTILIVMGVMLLRDGRRAKLEMHAAEAGQSGINPVISGIIGSLSNPYWAVWWLTIGFGYLASSLKYGAAGVIAFFMGHIAADLGWYSLISFAVARGRRVMGQRVYRTMLSACGVFLICFGLWFFLGTRF